MATKSPMRPLARLRRFFSALVSAVTRRKRRRSHTSVPPSNDPIDTTTASRSETAVGEPPSEYAASGSEEPGTAVAPPPPHGVAERDAALSPDSGVAATSAATDTLGSRFTAGTGADQSNATAGAPPETTAPAAVFHDQSAHALKPPGTIPDPTCATQVDAPTAPGVSKTDEPLPEVVAPRTSAMPNDAVHPSPDATPTAPAQSVHAIELGAPIFVPTGTPQSVPPAAPNAIEVDESPASASALEPQAAINDVIVESPSSTNEPGQDPATVTDVRDANGSTPQDPDSLTGSESMATIDEPDLDAALALQEVDAEAEALPDDSEIGGAETEQPRLRRAAFQRRASPPERRPEPSTEYTTLALPPPSDDYRTWNRAIAEHLLFKSAAGSDLYLTITPRILARAWAEVQGATLNAEEAQQQFADAVSQLYRARVLTSRGRLRVLRHTGDDGLPECIAFLALTVLAAYRMHGDDEATGLAYYLRLGELLRCDLSGPYPTGFDPFVFESLWHFLRDWLAQRDLKLAVPAPEAGGHRFVGLPLAHVPLRSLDIDKLPNFFFWASYQPSSEVTAERLADDFARWVRARGALTAAGVAAFADARRSAVLAEIRAELDAWDGTCDESASRRSASVEILFDPVQHRPELFYVPRRPSGFPSRFDDGVHAFEGVDEGWYGRISITPPDGSELANGFNWRSAHSGVEFALRRSATSVISMAPGDDYSGFISARGLRRNVQCAVLCREDVVQTAVEYLSHVSERACKPLRHKNLPDGWSLFGGIVARRLAGAPAGLESLDVQANVGLIPSGGIRLGNRWSWLQGAPPRIIVAGAEPELTVTVDGSPADVDEDGLLRSGESLSVLGAHVVQVGPVRRTVEIVEPSIHMGASPKSARPDGASAPVMLALPPGRWTVVGTSPGQTARSKHAFRNGTIIACAFSPAWAICVGQGHGATVLNVFSGPGAPLPPQIPRGKNINALSGRDMRDWTSSIYDAAVQHPRIETLAGEQDPAASDSWKTYARCAAQIKRMIRRSHR